MGEGWLAVGIVAGRTVCPHGHQPVRHRPTRERPYLAEHQDAFAIRRGDRQQIPRAAFGGLMRSFRNRFPLCDWRPFLSGSLLYSSSNSSSSLTLSLCLYRGGTALRPPSDPVTKGWREA